MSEVLGRWNGLSAMEAESEIQACCGSPVWAREMASRRPIDSKSALLSAADEVWRRLGQEEWQEAFRSHARIGESRAQIPPAEKAVAARSSGWSQGEQSSVAVADDTLKTALAETNREYETKFGHIFIICASGKSGTEILKILHRRLTNEPAAELREAAEQQRQITSLRLEKWLAE